MATREEDNIISANQEFTVPFSDGFTDENGQFTLISDFDIELFKAGRHYHLYNKLGNHRVKHNGQEGVYFAVWAPNARLVSVFGSFNHWSRGDYQMTKREDGSGIWETFIPGLSKGDLYKYYIESNNGYTVEKGDPYAYYWETPPKTATVVKDINFVWDDDDWLKKRGSENALSKPISVYEVHLGSWRRNENGEFLSYLELATELPKYCKYMNFTHVEFMPIMEHPFYGSWGYQITGYFAPSSRFGTPQDFMYLINELHKEGIGVILDWVPSHFPTDQHGLSYFDGTHLYEYADPRKGFHPDWRSNIFDFGRNEVRSFLISNALFWLDKYHIDGLRVDAVASMLYLDYSRKDGEWIPNIYGGRENLEAISFLKEFNAAVHDHHPEVFTVAEESTAWPGVTHPTSIGGLGFDMKWMMGWMHDTLHYFQTDPIYRSYHQGEITFSLVYAFTEKFTLPLSHDEVVYGKHSMINKMPGDDWKKFANLRLLYSYMYGHPGAKLLFMGGEFAQRHEWQHDFSLDWHENSNPYHRGIQSVIKDLNELYTTEPAFFENNFSHEGFEWIDINDHRNSVISWVRKGKDTNDHMICVANFTPVPQHNYRIGSFKKGYYREVFNSDNLKYSGSNILNNEGEIETFPIPKHGRTHSMSLTLPPLGLTILKYVKDLEW
ncbi:1,4-alpha-glucan branching protein GlgB [Desertivirga arenae]|uniref:1,4-alpha-glucan branching protein GlgB n=1 Tax=Desertivirga arenae TaxID=2810309 RepID=UPI001A95C306|nr:1,4-alpha-glucan branching protein GlgB [Pedobacter sp. SYSU D00823]